MAATVYIGTAGWTIPKQASAAFASGESALDRYATRFNAVEINSTFYRPHQPKPFARRAATVGENFRFSLKCRARLPSSPSFKAAMSTSGRSARRPRSSVASEGHISFSFRRP